MSNILEVVGLNKAYKDFSLTDVSFSLPEGCITGFIGANGAGKTTAIRTILGLSPKTSGTIKILGKEFATNEQELKNKIGVVQDDGGFYNGLTMAEMKSIIAPAYSKWDEKKHREYMDRFSLNPKQKIKTLSKGMRMKFALALALSHRAELLIMDEPTSGLDPLFRSQLLEIMGDYMKHGGRGVFFSTHITSDLEKVADMLILIHNGKILFEQEKDALIDSFRIIKGDSNKLTAENRKLFMRLKVTAFGFEGVTDRLLEVQESIPDIVVEKPTVEDIMLGSIEREEK